MNLDDFYDNNRYEPEVILLFCTPNSEDVIENIARVCYQKQPALNYRTGTIIKNMLASNPQHESPLEHAIATFKIRNVSRSLTHQLVRHRLSSFTQMSQRYCDEKDFSYIIPPSIKEKGLEEEYKKDMKLINEMYKKYKKAGCLSEDARYVLPNACCTEIVMTSNFRQWRNVVKLRSDKHAQWEIRRLSDCILEALWHQAPHVFDDLYKKFIKKE